MSIPITKDFHHGLLGLLRKRLATEFGSAGRVQAREEDGQFHVIIEMPARHVTDGGRDE